MSKLPMYACVLVLAQGCAGNDIIDSGGRGPGSGIPMVDEKISGFNAAKYAETDWPECKAYADRANQEGSVVEGAAGGALVGAMLGAMPGAWAGDAGLGAGIGASYGAMGGAAGSVAGEENAFGTILRNCLRGRGYSTLF